MKRTRLKPSKRARARRSLVRLLDADCRRKVFERDDSRCVRCAGTKNVQWAHIYSRRHKHLRWDPNNSLCLCAGCHLWWHDVPIESGTWFAQTYPERYQALRLARHLTVKVNLKELAEAL